MSEKKTDFANGAATAVLFLVILLVSIALALWTDIPVVARAAIAIVSGIAGAAITFISLSRGRS
ncbi:hypothetical protein [Microcella sp.]|uniref:hypothetical protein n=1 Tax=Microcella sp. TaxID=1913979 RepID=UPI00299F6351|nr:hypothetical protein [Microcella sp.]MDX2024810.1 hypothetical protein [Microcella sp.]